MVSRLIRSSWSTYYVGRGGEAKKWRVSEEGMNELFSHDCVEKKSQKRQRTQWGFICR